MSEDDPFDDAADAVVDGAPVDWAALARRAASAADRERLESLRLIAAIGALHRSLPDDAPPPSSTRTPRGIDAGPVPSPASTREPATGDDGARWGRYRLLERIGAGSFGTVYRAWDPNLRRPVALKILHGASTDVRVRERLLREGQQLARLRDPNVVSVLDVAEHEGQFGLCMEFVDGETLDDVLRSRGTLNPREAVLVGQDVCRALAAAHAEDIVHRDVKARNIMRDRTGRIILMDFGAGRELEELERADPKWNQAGTPLYMAPELLAGRPATFSTDVYAVGVLLYFLVTGKYPVTGRTVQEIRTAHMYGMREPIGHRRTDLPAGFVAIVDRALAPNPEQRYRSVAEMLDDLGAVNLPPPPLITVRRVAAGAAVAPMVMMALGIVITRYFDATMGREEFVEEGVREWLTWGGRSLIGPLIYAAFAVIGVTTAAMFYRAAAAVFPRVREIEAAAVGAVRRSGLHTADDVAAVALLLSVTMVAGTSWYFADLLRALTIYPDVSRAPAMQLHLLSPAYTDHQVNYRLAFTWVTIAAAALWYVTLRLASRRREAIHPLLLAGAAAVMLVTVLLWAFPYRMLSSNNSFPVARWQNARCYILGERRDSALLFCPALVPRSRVVASSAVERTGDEESPFALFSPSPSQ
jgi:serine/threonine-protein kinase